ncbi:ethanolamine utilization protein [Penicillium lividum]|nr:ethanolamine utilization protein [Penicillium lividum]
MPFITLSKSALQRIPHLEGAPSYVHFVDTFGTPKASGTQNPLTGSLFYVESTDDDQELRLYNYDETGVVLKGILVLEDETGKIATLEKGDTFFIHRGSRMRFTTPNFGIAFKGASRWKNVTKL